jgi:hypothetical protein
MFIKTYGLHRFWLGQTERARAFLVAVERLKEEHPISILRRVGTWSLASSSRRASVGTTEGLAAAAPRDLFGPGPFLGLPQYRGGRGVVN